MKHFLLLLTLITSTAFAAAGDRDGAKNPNQDKDLNFCVNKGGVETCPLVVKGTTGAVVNSSPAEGSQTIAVTGGTTTLTHSSPTLSIFTGTGNQTVHLPLVTSGYISETFTFHNLATGNINIFTNAGGFGVAQLVPNTSVSIKLVSTASETATSWALVAPVVKIGTVYAQETQTGNGAARIGNTNGLNLNYDNSGNSTLNFDFGRDSASSQFNLRTRTAGTAINAFSVTGAGQVSLGASGGSQQHQVNGSLFVSAGGLSGLTSSGGRTGFLFVSQGDGGTNSGNVYCPNTRANSGCLAAINGGVFGSCATTYNTSNSSTFFLCFGQ